MSSLIRDIIFDFARKIFFDLTYLASFLTLKAVDRADLAGILADVHSGETVSGSHLTSAHILPSARLPSRAFPATLRGGRPRKSGAAPGGRSSRDAGAGGRPHG